jgi:hypothetical protein
MGEAAESLTIPGVVVRGKGGREVRGLPARLFPLRDLLGSTDPHDRIVLDDWIESQEWNVAAELWLLTKPTDFQSRITIMVVGRGTHLGHYPDLKPRLRAGHRHRYRTDRELEIIIRSMLAEAKRQLTIHRHAHWVRVIEDAVATTPQGEEAMLDVSGMPDLGEARVVTMRTRCEVPGCVISCTGTQVIPDEDDARSQSNTITQKDER